MVFLSLRCCCAGLALSLLVLAPAGADDVITPAKIDVSRINDQPVYPEGAKEKKEQGITMLAISLDARTRILKVTVDTTSGFTDLDQAAVAAADRWYFVAASDGHRDVPGVAEVKVHFQLSPLPSPPVTETDVYALADIGDMIVCRTPMLALGSNITPKRVCAPKREWDEATRRNNDQHMPSQRPNAYHF